MCVSDCSGTVAKVVDSFSPATFATVPDFSGMRVEGLSI